ncbi:MAG: hypothetical protein K6A65_03645 [Succinivibrionaceae bacterium]|nr:hypothetical protein [Succinivibrionaceae bacterium]
MAGEVDGLGPVRDDPRHVSLALAEEDIAAGFPVPNGGRIDGELDINDFLVGSPSSTYVFRVRGDDLCDIGIMGGDYVLADTARALVSGDTVVAKVEGDYVVREFHGGRRPCLISRCLGNEGAAPIPLGEESEVEIVGPVISVVRRYR